MTAERRKGGTADGSAQQVRTVVSTEPSAVPLGRTGFGAGFRRSADKD
jgi:hypothetical protein